MGLIGKWLGYERTLTEAKEAMALKDERIARLEKERESLAELIHRLTEQLKKAGIRPAK